MVEERDPLVHEKEIARRTQADNAREVSLCERFLGHLTLGFNRLAGSFEWQEPNGTILGLATLGHNSLRWAFEALLKGYYTQANALSRLAWECWLHGVYLLFYPDQLGEWLEFKTRPKPSKMRKLVTQGIEEASAQLKQPIDGATLRADLDRMYSFYSEYSHPSDIAVTVLVGKRNNEVWLRLGGEYDGLLLVQSADMFCYATEVLFMLLYVLLPEDSEYQELGTALRKELSAWRKASKETLL